MCLLANCPSGSITHGLRLFSRLETNFKLRIGLHIFSIEYTR